MATLVCFHAHPDDECISTGGTMARAASEGHRVVLVVATDGGQGEVPDDLPEGTTLADRRRDETLASAEVLGVARVEFLGYADSGMTGWEANDAGASFHRADVDEAAERLAEILRDERADVLTIYDWHGTYGHPDHVKVHAVGARAAELVERPPRVLEATSNRDEMVAMLEAARDAGVDVRSPDDDPGDAFDPSAPADDGNPFGEPADVITLRVDVRAQTGAKREAMRRHRSQITDSSFFLEMPDDVFDLAFGQEWFIERDRRPPWREGWVFEPSGGADG